MIQSYESVKDMLRQNAALFRNWRKRVNEMLENGNIVSGLPFGDTFDMVSRMYMDEAPAISGYCDGLLAQRARLSDAGQAMLKLNASLGDPSLTLPRFTNSDDPYILGDGDKAWGSYRYLNRF